MYTQNACVTFKLVKWQKHCTTKSYRDMRKGTEYKICYIRAVFLEGNAHYI